MDEEMWPAPLAVLDYGFTQRQDFANILYIRLYERLGFRRRDTNAFRYPFKY